MKPENLVRMQDVADLAGVHRTTVSLALRGDPRIAEETRTAVRRAAERLGYRPNPLVSALMAYRSTSRAISRHTTLAFVTSSKPADAWRQSKITCAQFAGVCDRAQELGFNVAEFALFSEGMTPERLNRVLRERGILGVIVAPLRSGTPTLPLAWEHFSAVGMAFTLQGPNIPRIGNDHSQSVRRAIRECRSRGYRRIGLALRQAHVEWVEQQWVAGYLVEHHYPTILVHPRLLIADRWEEKSFLSWFRAERPDVVVTGGGAEQVISWLRRAGRSVPADVGVVSLDVQVRDGSVAGIDQNSEKVGAAVVDALIARLQRNERGLLDEPVRIHLMGTWVGGATIRAQI